MPLSYVVSRYAAGARMQFGGSSPAHRGQYRCTAALRDAVEHLQDFAARAREPR